MVTVVMIGVLSVLPGCSDTAQAPPPPPATVNRHWAGCDLMGAYDRLAPPNDSPGKGGIPADFTPVAAVLCETTDRPGKTALADPVLVDLERRAVEIGPLLGYLSRPGRVSTDPDDLVCPAMAWLPPWLFLLDASGRWISPQLPTNECGFALDDVATDAAKPAWSALPFTDKVIRVRGQR